MPASRSLVCSQDAAITFDDVPRLDYARAVFAETMRLYPPAWITSREALVPVTIGGVTLRAGDLAIVSPYVTHRDPRFWPDAERYDPARFLDERPRERYAYFPLERIGSGDVEPRPLVTLRPRTSIAARVRRRRAPADSLPCEPTGCCEIGAVPPMAPNATQA